MFNTIVFAYDGSAECREALAEGIALAGKFQARCHLLAVIPPPPVVALAEGPLPIEVTDADTAAVTAVLNDGVAQLRASGIDASGHIKSNDEPAHAIVEFANATHADLVIVGHHPRTGVARWWHGSVGHALLDHLPCSLLVSMPRQRP